MLSGKTTEKTYGELQNQLEEDLAILDEISTNMQSTRCINGAMHLSRDELEFQFGEDQIPTDVTLKKKNALRRITREFKILANISVAQKISSCLPEQTILRRQAPPIESKIVELQQYVKKLGYDISISSAGDLQKSVDTIEDEQVRKAITIIILKTLQPPKYFCTGTMDILKYSHYSLNLPLYTHFTSPSRRFADLIVQRQLKCALDKGM